MKKYIKIDIVEAEPMTLAAYNEQQYGAFDTWESDAGGYKILHSDGFLEWMSKEEFETKHHLCDMTVLEFLSKILGHKA